MSRVANQETLGSILKHVRRGDVEITSFAEALPRYRAIAHDNNGRIPSLVAMDTIIFHPYCDGALIRNSQVIPIHHDTVLQKTIIV